MAQITVQTMMLKVFKMACNRPTSFRLVTPLTLNGKAYSTEKKESEIKKSVFISQSKDIFSNLALEDWMYKNFDFSKHHVLLLWQNDPCVVIGRHQNPWLEANLSDSSIILARRNSGGGTVYHDQGNLNLTFFTARDSYSRKNNLGLISRALYREWRFKTEINSREDIVVNGDQKISGTASKLGHPNAYHHCTLLVDVNKANLSRVLQKKNVGIFTNATRSVSSPVMNLCDVNEEVNVKKLLTTIGWEYLRTRALSMEDGGKELISQQNGFSMINPIEYYFPGLDEIRDEFSSWDWRFGKTPKFTITRSFSSPQELVNIDSDQDQELSVTLQITKGMVEDATIKIPPGLMPINGFQFDENVINLRGSRFSEESMKTLEKSLTNTTMQSELKKQNSCHQNGFVSNSMRQVVKNA